MHPARFSLLAMEIRAARAEETGQIESLVSIAFAEHGAQVVAAVRALRASGAERASLVAVDAGAVIGHVGLSRGWIDARARLVEALVLSPLSVDPGRQRGGIGTALIAAALSGADRLGAPCVFLEGDWEFYGRRGFQAGRELGFAAPSDRIPGPAFQVARLSGFEPWMLGRLVYPEAFWATGTVGLRDPLLSEVEQRLADRAS
jgi:putative acetyltransferase